MVCLNVFFGTDVNFNNGKFIAFITTLEGGVINAESDVDADVFLDGGLSRVDFMTVNGVVDVVSELINSLIGNLLFIYLCFSISELILDFSCANVDCLGINADIFLES